MKCSHCGGRSFSQDRSKDGVAYCDDCNTALAVKVACIVFGAPISAEMLEDLLTLRRILAQPISREAWEAWLNDVDYPDEEGA